MLLLLLFCLILSGCVRTKIIEDILLVQGIGFDKAGDKAMKGTLTYSKYSGPQARNLLPQIITEKGRTVKSIESKVNSKVALPVELGQLRVAVFGDEMAKQGIKGIVDTLIRDPEVGTGVYLAVVEGTAEHLLNQTYEGNYTVPSMYITNLFEQNMRTQSLPTTNLHVYAYHLYDPSCDSILPLIGREGSHLGIKGLAFFHNSRYVAKIGTNRMFVFKRLYEDAPSGLYEVDFPFKGKKAIVDIREVASKVSYDVKDAGAVPTITVNVDMHGAIVENSNVIDLKKEKSIRLVQEMMEKEFRMKAEKMIKRFQKLGIDPLCIGSKVRSRNRSWDPDKWEDVYPRTTVRVKVDVDIQQTGAIN
jgi:spore germination protein